MEIVYHQLVIFNICGHIAIVYYEMALGERMAIILVKKWFLNFVGITNPNTKHISLATTPKTWSPSMALNLFSSTWNISFMPSISSLSFSLHGNSSAWYAWWGLFKCGCTVSWIIGWATIWIIVCAYMKSGKGTTYWFNYITHMVSLNDCE